MFHHKTQGDKSFLQPFHIYLLSLKTSEISRHQLSQYWTFVDWLTKYQPASSISNPEGA